LLCCSRKDRATSTSFSEVDPDLQTTGRRN